MKIIKYKAWDSIRSKWCDEATIMSDGNWTVFHCDTEEQICSWDKDSNRIEFVLFSGLKDKKRTEEYPKGQEMYGGDIIKTHFGGEDLVGVIKYADKWAKFYFAAKNRNGVGIAFDPESVFYWYYGEDDEDSTSIAEVIGNRFEHAHLLEQQ
jgi:hypothetical protein